MTAALLILYLAAWSVLGACYGLARQAAEDRRIASEQTRRAADLLRRARQATPMGVWDRRGH
jgi:hypothetical protein